MAPSRATAAEMSERRPASPAGRRSEGDSLDQPLTDLRGQSSPQTVTDPPPLTAARQSGRETGQR